MISTGTIPVEQKSVHWLSMGAASRNSLGGGGGVLAGSFFLGLHSCQQHFLGTAGNQAAGGFVNSTGSLVFQANTYDLDIRGLNPGSCCEGEFHNC